MVRTHLVPHRLMVVVTLLAIVAFGMPLGHGASAQGSLTTSPSLVAAVPILEAPGAVSITGQNFSPGGAVFVALYDRWGVEVYEPRWVVATTDTHGPDGSQDPALGFTRGGAIEAVFGMASTVYGLNGSQDPARGYVPASAGDATAGELCGEAVMVRAYDARTDMWSNVLDVALGC